MAISLLHATQVNTSSFPDDGTSPVGTNEWNAQHALQLASGALLGRTTAGTGAAEEITVGSGLTLTATVLDRAAIFKTLTAAAAYTNNTSAQPWFPSAGAATVSGTTTYLMEGLLLQGNGVTSHTVGLSFGGTATLTSVAYAAWAVAAVANTTATASNSTYVAQATNTVVTAAITAATTAIAIQGLIRINAAGTLIPQFQFSAAPGAGNVNANTYFQLVPLGSNTVVSQGTWA